MSLINKTASLGCLATAITLTPSFFLLGVASNICKEKGNGPLEKTWVLFGTPLLLGYASYALWSSD